MSTKSELPKTEESPQRASLPERIETLADATAYLDGLINRERSRDFAYVRLDLRPIRALLDSIGRPEEGLSVIHVAGSKGKGSTCLFAESILLALGERVGTFTSPHLESWVERFRLAGEPIAEERLVDALNRVRPVVDRLRAGPVETVPSFFDATTAIAFLIFAEASIDRALIEVGLGGRLDSTNVVQPAVTCITSIELEHTDKLGETLSEIAGEKAGILKARVPAVLGPLAPDAERVIRARARQLGAPVVACGEAFRLSRVEPGAAANAFEFEREGEPPLRVSLAVPGGPARWNAGLAIACVQALEAHDSDLLARAVREGLEDCILPARTEVLAGDPAVIVDAAHTAESARALAVALEELTPDGFDLLLSVSGDKNLASLLEALLPGAKRVWVTRAEPARSMPPELLAKHVRARAPDLQIDVVEDPVDAALRARAALDSDQDPGRRLCATGSVYLAGIARKVLGGELPR